MLLIAGGSRPSRPSSPRSAAVNAVLLVVNGSRRTGSPRASTATYSSPVTLSCSIAHFIAAVLDDGAQACNEPPDAFGDGRLLQRAGGDTEGAAVRHPERGTRDHRDLVLANQPLRDGHRIRRGLDLKQHVQGPVGRPPGDPRRPRGQFRKHDVADRG